MRQSTFLTTAIVFCICLTGVAEAQGDMAGFTYSLSFPTGGTKDYIDNESWIGFGVQGRRFINDNASVGLSIEWHNFFERTSEIIPLDNGAVSGKQWRYINAFPIHAHACYYLGDEWSTRPFFGAHVGTTYLTRRLEIGVYTITEDNWHFSFGPEIGVLHPLAAVDMLFSVKYHRVLEAGGVPRQPYLSINLGFLYTGGY